MLLKFFEVNETFLILNYEKNLLMSYVQMQTKIKLRFFIMDSSLPGLCFSLFVFPLLSLYFVCLLLISPLFLCRSLLSFELLISSYFLVNTFYSVIILDLQKNCKDSIESSYMWYTQLLLIFTSCVTRVH